MGHSAFEPDPTNRHPSGEAHSSDDAHPSDDPGSSDEAHPSGDPGSSGDAHPSDEAHPSGDAGSSERDAGPEWTLSAGAASYAAMTPEARLEAIEQLGAMLSGVHAELLDVMAASVACGDPELDGATTPAAWLVGRLGLARRNADEWFRAGMALQSLPELRAAYAAGELSWDQVRPATKFVTPDTDAAQASRLPGYSAAQIALMARQVRPVVDADANQAHASRSFSWRRNHRKGGFHYSGFLPFDQGEAVNQAIDSIGENWGADPATGSWAPIATRRADAVHDLATRRLGSASAPDRATVVIHADAAVIDGDEPGNGLIGDLAVGQSAVVRALCDARVEVALHGPDGATVGVARASQQIPWWLRRQVHARDRTCRGFGCDRKIRHIHHIKHWAKQGETNLDNLVGLCWSHHRLVHEGGWNITGNPNGEITFVNQSGDRRLPSRPQPRRTRPGESGDRGGDGGGHDRDGGDQDGDGADRS